MAEIVNLRVNADTSAAKQALQDLQRQLDQLSNPNKLTNSTMNSELLKAAQAAEVLKTQLTEATNVNTGRLDLSKFTQQLSQSGMSLEKYQQYFKSFGVEGQKAFSALATSIAQAEIPLKNMNTMTQKMWTSIKNTINWQISSSLIHGIVGQFSTMINYAKDLDKSLNNIQIVTGASAQKMTQFAQQANQAAKQLNTTTTAYTNASLIYYQQGLNDKEVKARTDVTVKLANVTKESVTDVSNQLTAIWNNFAKGSGNLEHFADVITALGAATASSSKEIATGLEKFASIADTVGLSYEKATAALATVTAKTRQSADTVGTGFRTIFSRLQSLSLGETLEDGVNLTKYTKALKTIGVQALDTSGNLRSMDNILMDVGEKWEKLTDSQKMAFANTVGGVRQYATLVALFDDFDQFIANLSIAEASDGTLQNQAEIFADSWEAASKRVRATAEGIYGRLIKSDDFEDLMDTFSGFLEMIQGIIDGLGGLQGVLVTLGAIATTVFGKQISTGLDNMGLSILTMGGLGEKRLMNMQKEAINRGIETWGGKDTRDQALILSKKNEAADNLAYLTYGSKMNETAAGAMRGMMDYNRKLYAQQAQAGEAAYNARIDYAANARAEAQAAYDEEFAKNAKAKFDAIKKSKKPRSNETNYKAAYQKWEKGKLSDEEFKAQYESYVGKPKIDTAIQTGSRAEALIQYSHASQLKNILGLSANQGETAQAAAQWRTMRAAIKDEVGTVKDANGNEQINYAKFFEGLGDLSSSAVKAAQALDAMETAAKTAEDKAKAEGSNKPNYDEARGKTQTEEAGEFTQQFDERENKNPTAPKTASETKVVDTERANIEARGNAALVRDNLLKYGEEQSKIMTGGEAISKIAGAATAATSAVMMLSNAFQVLGDDTASGSQKLGAIMSIIMSLGTAIPAVTGLIASMGKTVTLVGTEISLAFWQITLIAAAIGGLVAAIAWAKSEEDTNEKKTQRAINNARRLNDTYKEAKNSNQELKDAFADYDAVYEALGQCIKYSDDWNTALEKVNQKVLDMLQQFPELAKIINSLEFDVETGTYRFTQAARDAVLKSAQWKELVTQAANISGQEHYQTNQYTIDRDKFTDSLKQGLIDFTTYGTEDQYVTRPYWSSETLAQMPELAEKYYSSFFHMREIDRNSSLPGPHLTTDPSSPDYYTTLEEYVGELFANTILSLDPKDISKDNSSKLAEILIQALWDDEKVLSYIESEYGEGLSYQDILKKFPNFNLGAIISHWLETSVFDNKDFMADVISLQTTQKEITNTSDVNNKVYISQALKLLHPNETYDQSIIDILSGTYERNKAENYLSNMDWLQQGDNIGDEDDWKQLPQEVKDILNQYLEINDGKYLSFNDDDDDIYGGGQGESRTVKMKTKDASSGKIITEEVSIGEISSIVAAAQALSILDTSLETTTQYLTDLSTNIKNTFKDSEFKDTIINSIMSFFAGNGLGNSLNFTSLSNLSGKNLWEILGIAGDENLEQRQEAATFFHYESPEKMEEAWIQAREEANSQYQIHADAFKKNLGITDTEFINSEGFKGLNLTQLGAINQLYNKINSSKLATDAEKIDTTNILSSIFKLTNLTTDQIINLADIFGNQNWRSLTIDHDLPLELQSILGDLYNDIFDETKGINLTSLINSLRQVEIEAKGIDTGSFVKVMTGISSLLSTTIGTKISNSDITEKYKGIDFSKIGYTAANGDVVITADQDTIRKELLTQESMIIARGINDANTKLTADIANGVNESARNDLYVSSLKNLTDNLSYSALMDFLSQESLLSNADGSSKLISDLFDSTTLNNLKQNSLINYANMMGYNIAEIQQEAAYRAANASYYRTGEYGDIYEAQAEVIKEKDALAEAEKLRLDTAAIQSEAQRLWDHGEGGYTSYTEALEAVIKKESELFGFRKEITQEATDWNIDYDKVIEYAKQLRDIGKFAEDDIEGSEKYALSILKQNAAIETITNNYKNWLKVLNDSEEQAAASTAYKQAFHELEDSLRQLFNLSKKDPISKELMDWAQKTGNLNKLLEGNKDAWGEAFAVQAKGLIKNDKLIDSLSTKIDDFTKRMAKKKQGELITEDEVKEAQEIVKQVAKAREEAGEAMSNQDQVDLFKSLTNTDGNIGLDANGNFVKTITIDVQKGENVDAAIADALADVPEGTNVHIGYEVDAAPELNKTVTGSGNFEVGDIALHGEGLAEGADGAIAGGSGQVKIEVPVMESKGTPDGHKGGGGGGGKKAHKPKRYRNIENQIQNNSRKLESATRQKDRSFGTAKLDALKEERKLREENLKLQQQYQSEIEDWLGKDKTSMMDAFAKIGFKPIFDEFGEVINNDEFEALWEQAGEGAGEEWQEAADALDQYEETLDKYNDKLEEIKQIQEEIFDSFLEETQLEVEMKINVNTANIEYIDYLLGKIEDDAYQAAEAIALLGHKTGEIEIQASVYRKGINDILSHHTLADGTQLSLENIGSMTTDQLLAAGFTDAEIQELQKYRSELLQLNQQLLEMRDTVADKVVDALEKMNEEIQKSYENFDHYNSVLEHYKNINDLINIGNTKMSKEIAGKLNRAMLSNAQNQVKSAREIYDAAKLNMQNAQAEYENALAVGDEQTAKYWKKIMDAASDQLKEAKNQWLEAWEGALEQAKADFETAIQDIVDTYNEQMGSTFGSLDYLQTAYDRQKETNEQYLQDYDRLYELSKLSRDISKSIDDTDSIKGKQKLRDIQAEINKLQADGTKLSQYDIEALQKKYELEKARLALEDAQNAKQTVRLQRDSEGNWGYVYTADEDKVAEAEQEYEDKLHEYQKLNDEYIQELQDKVLSAQATYRDLIQEIMSDTTLTDKQRQARLEEVQNWYNEQINFFGQQLTNALNNQEGTLDRYYQRYNDERAKLVDSWKETTLSLLTGTGSMDDYMAHMRESASQMVETAYQALLQYKQDIDQTDAMAGQDSSFSEMVSGVVSGIGELSTATEASISTLADTMTDEFATALQAAVNWESQYVSEMMQMIAQTEAEVTAVNNLIAALSGLDTTALYAAANATVGAAGAGQASTSAANAAEQAAKATAAYSTNPYYASGEKKMTEDFLHIVNDNMVDCNVQLDDIIRILELQVNAFSEGLGALISAPGIMNESQDILEQNIHIDVSFPSVTEHSEIEKAFDNLINRAAQYANRKNP